MKLIRRTHTTVEEYEPDVVVSGPAATHPSVQQFPQATYPTSGTPNVGQRQTVFTDGEHNAFPGLAHVGGGVLLAAWRAASKHGTSTGASRGVVKLSRSTDYGRTWSAPVTIIDSDPADTRAANLTVLSDGTVLLATWVNDGTNGPVQGAKVYRSTDDGETWTGPTEIAGPFDGYNVIEAPIVELSDGTLLAPLYGKNAADASDRYSAAVAFSTDGGTTWGSGVVIGDGPTDAKNYTEPNIIETDSGLLCVMREEISDELHVATSTDDGATWTAPASAFSGSGRPALIRAASGAVVCLYRLVGAEPRTAMVRVSRDGGATWSDPAVVDGDDRYVYAQMVEVSGGQLATVYATEQGDNAPADVFFRYLLDGSGVSPLADSPGIGAAPATIASPLYVPVVGMAAYAGVPALSSFGAMAFDGAAMEAVVSAFAPPDDWTSMHVDLVWRNAGGGSGDVYWVVYLNALADGETLGATVQGSAIVTAPAGDVTVRTRLGTVPVTGGVPYRLRLYRVGGDAADTLPSDAGAYALLFTKAP